MTVEMELVGVKIQMPTNSPVLILKETEGEGRLVPIFIGGPEAHAIDLAVSGTKVARPMTHDLFLDTIASLNSKLISVVISDLKDGTFYASLRLEGPAAETIEVSARASDAVALAVRTNSPILAAETVIDEAGIVDKGEEQSESSEEEIIEELRAFLDDVKPEDFS